MQKGVSDSTSGDTGTIDKNDTMKILINNNISEIDSMIDLYPKDAYLSKIYSILTNIKGIFINGGTSTELATLNESLSTNLNSFMQYGTGTTWYSIADMKEIYSACVLYQSSSTATTEEKTVARKIAGRFKEQIIDVVEKKQNEQIENNSRSEEYYCEIYYLYQFKSFLSKTVVSEFNEHSTYSESILTFLDSRKLITSGSVNSIYDARKSILEREKTILSSGNSSTNLVITTGVLTSENKTKLLNIINSMITNYSSYSTTISYTNFNQYDREVYNSILSVDRTSGFLTQSLYIDNTPLLVTKTKEIIDNLTASKDDSSTNSGDISKINEVIAKLKDPYDRLLYFGSSYESENKSIIGSRAVAVAEILQVISNEPRIFQEYAK